MQEPRHHMTVTQCVRMRGRPARAGKDGGQMEDKFYFGQ